MGYGEVPVRWSARRRVAASPAAWLLAITLAACAIRQTVVLVPDPDGRVGEVRVTTAGGTQVLNKAGDMTTVTSAVAPPAAVTTAEPAYIAAAFGEALAVAPAPPEKFTLYFELGKTTLVRRSRGTAAAIAAAAKRRGAIEVSVSGHTDATGPDAFNDWLARARAERTRALLLKQGVAPGLMSVSSHGKRNPAVPTRDGVFEPRNRRAEVIVQ